MFSFRTQRIFHNLPRIFISCVAVRGVPAVARRFVPSVKDVATSCVPRGFTSGFLETPKVLINFPIRRFYASKSYPPHNVITMPALSPTMTMGNVGAWKKKVGDSVSPGDVLVEIETDKAQMDFECQEEGYLAKILAETGTKDVNVGSPIGVLAEEKDGIDKFLDFVVEDASSATKATESKEQSTEPIKIESQKKTESEQKPASGRIFASPLARKIADVRGIPLDQVVGTGPNDRIIKADVEDFVSHVTQPSAIPVSQPGLAYTDIPVSNIRRVIASRLSESKQSVPHYYLTLEVEMDKILKLREVLNKDSDGKYKLSVNDFIIKASALALKNVPEVNSSWHGDFIRQYHSSDISIATATPSGLITPIITSADTKGLATISQQVRDLAARAREGKLVPHEYQGGTFSISNLGMYGIKSFTAIINPPQSCILAVGTTTKKLIPDESQKSGYKIANTMHITLSCDHRVVDGAVGADWLKSWRSYIENPLRLLL